MNKRQKKKAYRKVCGKNPDKNTRYSSEEYHRAIGKPYGGLTEKAKRQQETIKNLHGFIKFMVERRKQCMTKLRRHWHK